MLAERAAILQPHAYLTLTPEGGQAYGYIRTVACGRLRNYGFQVPDDTDSRMLDPDSLICHPEEMGALEALYDLQVRAFQRVGTALRRYDRELSLLLQEPASGERTELILGRFLRDRLDALDASEARKAAWLAQPQSQTTSLVTSPAWPAAQLVSIVLILLWFRWRSRQSQVLASTEEAAA